MATDRHLVRIVVIDVHFYFNLAAILELFYFHFCEWTEVIRQMELVVGYLSTVETDSIFYLVTEF